jgi:hypothetical protein
MDDNPRAFAREFRARHAGVEIDRDLVERGCRFRSMFVSNGLWRAGRFFSAPEMSQIAANWPNGEAQEVAIFVLGLNLGSPHPGICGSFETFSAGGKFKV